MRMLTVGQTIYQLYFIPKDNMGKNCLAQPTQFFDAIVRVH